MVLSFCLHSVQSWFSLLILFLQFIFLSAALAFFLMYLLSLQFVVAVITHLFFPFFFLHLLFTVSSFCVDDFCVENCSRIVFQKIEPFKLFQQCASFCTVCISLRKSLCWNFCLHSLLMFWVSVLLLCSFESVFSFCFVFFVSCCLQFCCFVVLQEFTFKLKVICCFTRVVFSVILTALCFSNE